MSRVVPAWRAGCLGGDAYSNYVCLDCKLIIKTNEVGKGAWIINDDIFICPVCSSKEKEPTDKMSQEDIEKKKQEIKDRKSNA